MSLEEDERSFEEGGRTRLRLVWQDFGVGEAGRVVDSDVEGFPAQSLAASPSIALAASVAGDAVPDALDAAELL